MRKVWGFGRRAALTACAVTLTGLTGALLASPASAQKAPADLSAAATPVQRDQDRVVVTGMVPVPDVGPGAPLYTAEDVDHIADAARTAVQKSTGDFRMCARLTTGGSMVSPRAFANAGANVVPTMMQLVANEVQASDKAAAAASKALTVTQAAEDVRRAAAVGKATPKAVEAAELKRQDAVNKMDKARLALLEAQAMTADFQQLTLEHHQPDWSALRMKAEQRRQADVGLGIAKPDHPDGLSIAGVNAVQTSDAKGDLVAVFGVIKNAGEKSARVPELSGSLIDSRGWVVASTSVSPNRNDSIPAGGEYAFGFEVRPAPGEVQKAIVTFLSQYAPPPKMGVGLTCQQAELQPPQMLGRSH